MSPGHIAEDTPPTCIGSPQMLRVHHSRCLLVAPYFFPWGWVFGPTLQIQKRHVFAGLSQLKSLKSVGLQPHTLWLFWAQEEEKQIQEASKPAVVKVVGETSVVVLCPETGTFFRWDSSLEWCLHRFFDPTGKESSNP